MKARLCNAQSALPVYPTRMRRLAASAIRRLRIKRSGVLSITFVDGRRMRSLNQRALGHDRATDVVTLRYDQTAAISGLPDHARQKTVIGDIVVCPALAHRYARKHGLPYAQELARYVVHGILHWKGLRDTTAAEKRRMRAAEERLLKGNRFMEQN